MAYKVFTNGSVLNASDINTNLMNQSVMVFSNSTARAAALTSPVEGMLTWLEDVNRYEYRNGSGAWVALASPSGLTLVAQNTFTAATSVSINNCFTSTYNSYQIVVSSTVSVSNNPMMRLRVGGVDATTNYNFGYVQGIITSVSGNRGTSQDRFYIGTWDLTGGMIIGTLHGVALPQQTYGIAQVVSSAIAINNVGLSHTTATAYDGLTLMFAGNTTGQVRIYGLEN